MMARTALLSRSCKQLECPCCIDGENGCCGHFCHVDDAFVVEHGPCCEGDCADPACFCTCEPAPLTDTTPSRLDLAIDALLNEFGFVPEARAEAHDRIWQALHEAAFNSHVERERLSINALVAAVRQAGT